MKRAIGFVALSVAVASASGAALAAAPVDTGLIIVPDSGDSAWLLGCTVIGSRKRDRAAP